MRCPLVVMGVSGSGKTTFGTALAQDRGWVFVDGDDLHSPESIAKMRQGIPLDDADRLPWLAAVGAILSDATAYPEGVVVACSALKHAYRDHLRRAIQHVGFIFLSVDRATLQDRLAKRTRHFMPTNLIESQFATLEAPTGGEADVLVLNAGRSIDELRVLACGWPRTATDQAK